MEFTLPLKWKKYLKIQTEVAGSFAGDRSLNFLWKNKYVLEQGFLALKLSNFFYMRLPV